MICARHGCGQVRPAITFRLRSFLLIRMHPRPAGQRALAVAADNADLRQRRPDRQQRFS
jgi:hypothetical protein